MSASYDTVIIGAGFGGICQAYKSIQLGHTVNLLERAESLGGTWYWNRYPGAMSDSHSYLYRFSWDKEDLLTYPWKDNYLDAADVLAYLNHVVDRHDLRKHMTFDTVVESMTWNDSDHIWTIKTNNGVFTARYVVTAVGLLSEPNWPNISGLDSFEGSLYHTARWSKDYSLGGKRVAVIGNGSTGVQLVTEIAPQVGSLLCLQRHPQYSVPAGRKAVSIQERAAINQEYDKIWDGVKLSRNAGGVEEATLKTTDVSSEERDRIYQSLWDQGNGPRFMMGSFSDIVTDEAANKTASDFIKTKIAETVRDPEKRRKMTPKELYARRPICDSGYYEQFNRTNVDIIDILENPIAEVTKDGVKLDDGSFHQLDVLICATGFNAFDGAYRRIQIQGRGGLSLNEHWKDGPTTNMGVVTAGFPNMFMIMGPKSPLANVPPVVEAQVDFISAAMKHVDGRQDITAIESSKQGDEDWGQLCDMINEHLLFRKVDSYFNGSNVDGKARSTMIFFGGFAMLAQRLQGCVDGGFPSFKTF